ncbi:MAG: hypothetical protein ACREAN_06375 [Nitrosopumilaceae archaeon]
MYKKGIWESWRKVKYTGYEKYNMKKEFVVVRIEGSPDGSPYVVVSLSNSKDFREQQSTPMSPFGAGGVMGFTNMDDMMKNLNKMLAGGMGQSGAITSIKLDIHEYKDLNLAVGDKIYLELTKAESLGV